jgi:hypothetical protein
MDTTTVSLILSCIGTLTAIGVAMLHYKDRNDTVELRTEQAKSVYAKADLVKGDLDGIRHSIDTQLRELKDELEKLDVTLTKHLIDDTRIQTKLITNVTNLTSTVEEKLEEILKELKKLK